MHIIEYVHRDVSAGNVLFYKGNGILGDLEFAKRTSDLTVHEVRTVRIFPFSCAGLPLFIDLRSGHESI
jgi:radical SAM superfamily enzyme YgiQ (UPF0313 family)